MVHKQGAGVDDLGHLLPSITQGGGGGGGGHIIIILRTPAYGTPVPVILAVQRVY